MLVRQAAQLESQLSSHQSPFARSSLLDVLPSGSHDICLKNFFLLHTTGPLVELPTVLDYPKSALVPANLFQKGSPTVKKKKNLTILVFSVCAACLTSYAASTVEFQVVLVREVVQLESRPSSHHFPLAACHRFSTFFVQALMISVTKFLLAPHHATNNCTRSSPIQDKGDAHLFTTVRSNHVFLVDFDPPGPVVFLCHVHCRTACLPPPSRSLLTC